MTISNTTVKQIFQGNGSNKTFAIPFDFVTNSEVEVWERDESGTAVVLTQKAETTDFAFDAIPAINVVFNTAPASTSKIIIIRNNPEIQDEDYIGTGPFPAETHESILDKQVRLIQERLEEISRCAKLGIGTTIADLQIPEPVANGFLRFNAAGTQLELVLSVGADTITVPLTTKGDLWGHDGTSQSRLPIGTQGQHLAVDTAESLSLKWVDPVSGIGGVGSGWHEGPGSPLKNTDTNGELIYLFKKGGTGKLVLYLKVPQGYTAGQAIVMRLGFFSASAVNEWRMNITSTLIEVNTDAITSTADQETPNSGDITNTLANMYREVTFAISDAAGLIGGTAVAPGDMVKIELTRGTPAGTEDTADINFMPSLTEVTL